MILPPDFAWVVIQLPDLPQRPSGRQPRRAFIVLLLGYRVGDYVEPPEQVCEERLEYLVGGAGVL